MVHVASLACSAIYTWGEPGNEVRPWHEASEMVPIQILSRALCAHVIESVM